MPISQPLIIVTTAASAYAGLLYGSSRLSWPSNDTRTNLKAISSAHSTLTTIVGIYALTRQWPVNAAQPSPVRYLPRLFDDSRNPLIFGKSWLGNAVTSFETAYLLYDTIALLELAAQKRSSDRVEPVHERILSSIRKEPLIYVHHFGILTGLSALQVYISKNQERGVWIIVALILMNASTPVLHYRWWQRKRTGQNSLKLDFLLAAIFATCRLGTIGWILKTYGNFHGVDPWEALKYQRYICQVGTGALFILNAVWLANLLKGTVQRLR